MTEASDPKPSRTQAIVLTAYVELIEELGSDDIPYRLIARRAGVSERTVFRSYPTRVDLLRATAAWIQRRTFTAVRPHSVFDVPLDVRDAMLAFDAQPELAHVVAETSVCDEDAPRPSDAVAHVSGLVHDELRQLPARQQLSLTAALTYIASSATWVTLRSQMGMDVRDIADAAAWASEIVLNSARSRHSPL